MTKLARYKKAFIKTVKRNKQLVIGVAIGALIMLPMGLYANHRVSNSQRTPREPLGGTTTTPLLTDTSSNTKTLSPTAIPSGTGSSKNATQKFVPGVCTKTTKPQTTVYEDVGWLSVGETKTYIGVDGWKQTCTPGSDGYTPKDVVYDGAPTKIYRGTSPKQTQQKFPCDNIVRESHKSSVVSSYRLAKSKEDNSLWAYQQGISIGQTGYTQAGYEAMVISSKIYISNLVDILIADHNAQIAEYWICTPITRSELNL